MLLAVDLGLRVLPFRRIQALVARQRQNAAQPEPSETAAIIQHLERMVDIAAHNHLYPMQCLRRSLTLQWLLARWGIATALRFGVRRETGDLNAHAWLEYAGQPIGEPQAITARFAPLVTGEATR